MRQVWRVLHSFCGHVWCPLPSRYSVALFISVCWRLVIWAWAVGERFFMSASIFSLCILSLSHNHIVTSTVGGASPQMWQLQAGLSGSAFARAIIYVRAWYRGQLASARSRPQWALMVKSRLVVSESCFMLLL